MKKFLLILFAVAFCLPCFASKNNETIISYINLNDRAFFDVEILLTKDEKIFIPFKQLSEIFEVKVKTNHGTKEINFETSDGKKGTVGLNSINFDGKLISSKKNFYLKNGLMEDIKDEIFCDEKDLSIIFDSKIKTDKNDLSVTAKTDRALELLKTQTQDSNVELLKSRAYANVIKPDKNRKIFFESVSVNNNTMTDTISEFYLNETRKNVFFNNNSQFLLKGRAFDGDLNLDLNTYNYKGELFSFGGMGFNYLKTYKEHDYQFGKLKGILDDDYSIGNQTFGFQVSNYRLKPKTYRDIEGYVQKDSLVKVFINDVERETLSTYDGYYSLKNLYLDCPTNNLRLEELKSDGSMETIYTSSDNEKKRKYTLLGGVTGYNNNLFGTNGYIYELNTKKILLLGRVEQKFKKDFKFDSNISYDKIFSKPENSIWKNIYSKDALLTSGTWKNPNNLEGITSFNSLEFAKNDNLKTKFIFGLSASRDLSFNNENQTGWTLSLQNNYVKNDFHLNTGFFNTSSDFYLAGANGSYFNDQTGAFLKGGVSNRLQGLEGSFKRYFSNSLKRFDGGLIDFSEYGLNMYRNFDRLCKVKFNITGKEGANSLAENKSYHYDLNFSKTINEDINLQAGKTESNYQTSYNTNDYNDFNSLYSTVYLKGDFRLPKNSGMISLAHDVVKYGSIDQDDKYNSIKIAYTFPEIKRLTLSLGTGYKYKGVDNGFDFSANLAYRTKTGRTFNVNYQFNKTGGYLINNIYFPMNNRHSINITLNDAFQVFSSGLKSVGFADNDRGYINAVAYIDKNKNGKFDKDDIRVKNVPIKFSWIGDPIFTDGKGRVYPQGIEAGVYSVKVDTDILPATLFVDKNFENEKLVRIESRKNTRIEFPLKSCVGNISGKLKIIDDFGRLFNIQDFIVVLYDSSGKEVSYSTVNPKGEFNFSGVEPGKYTITLDDYFIGANALSEYENKSKIQVEIPYVYKKFVDIDNLNLIYKCD